MVYIYEWEHRLGFTMIDSTLSLGYSSTYNIIHFTSQ